MNDEIHIYGVNIENGNNPFDFKSFNSLPFCKIEKPLKIKSFLSEEKIFPRLPFNMSFQQNISHSKFCTLKITNKNYKRLYNYTINNMWIHLLLKHVTSFDLYSQIGYQKLDYDNNIETYIFSHFNFDIGYSNEQNNFISSVNLTTTNPKIIHSNMTLDLTYSVNWIKSIAYKDHNKINTAFFHSSTRFLIFTSCFCFVGLLYYLSSSFDIKHIQISTIPPISLSMASSGLTIFITLCFCFILNSFTKQPHFQNDFLFYTLLISSLISGYVSSSLFIKYINNDNLWQYLINYLLIIPSIYFFYYIIIESNHYKLFYISTKSIQYFIIIIICNTPYILGMFLNKFLNQKHIKIYNFERKDLITTNQQQDIKITHNLLILSAFIGLSTLLFTVSESYFIFTGYMKRKYFELWLLPFGSLILLYFNNSLEMKIIYFLYPQENLFIICCFSSIFSGIFNYISFIFVNGINYITTSIYGLIFSICFALISFSSYYISLYI